MVKYRKHVDFHPLVLVGIAIVVIVGIALVVSYVLKWM